MTTPDGDMREATLPCLRDLFEIPDDIAYLDAAAASPLPRVVRLAGEAGLGNKSRPWASAVDINDFWDDRARAVAARLIGATSDDVAIVSAVSHGLATATRSLDLPKGARVLRMANEHYSIVQALDRLAAEKQLILETVELGADGDWTTALLTEIVRPNAPPLALAALTPLHWSDGALVDLERLAPAIRAQGGALVVDATQAIGAMALDVRTLMPDFLIFPTYKWLVGPFSLAFLYAAPHRQQGVPLDYNNSNHPGGIAAKGARRYDKGQRNDPVMLSMAALGMELIETWSVPAITIRLRNMTDHLAKHIARLELSVLPRHLRAPHILGVRIPGGLPRGLIAALADAGVYTSDRLGVLRVSPHVWANEADLNHCAEAVELALAKR